MSQSPLDPQGSDGLQSYRQGWQALNRLLHENKSFSGRETNNAFLNCGKDMAFADVSTTIGWDFSDDARAIGLIDYDHDGDLDLFVTNRTAPRVRLLQNNLKSESKFLSLHLTGTGKTTPRDAIGARVEVHLKGQAIPHIRTLHAGQSFLAQSSRWLHFGLGEKAHIEKIIVHWPGSSPQIFSRIKPNQHLHLTQGSPTGIPRKSRQGPTLKSIPQPLPKKTSLARIIPPAGHALPTLPTANGKPLAVSGTTLIALWSRTCPHCREELTTWSKEANKLKTSGINLSLLCTDQEPITQAEAFLESINSPFDTQMATPEAVELLDAIHASIIDLWVPIPVPTSFLVSKDDQLLAIYRGPTSIEQITSDMKLAASTSEERRTAGSPFPGRWTGEPSPSSPQRTAQQLVQRARPNLSITYLRSALSKPFLQDDKFTRSDSLLLLGQLLGQQGRPAEAIPYLETARQLFPEDIRILRLIATAHAETGDLAQSYATFNATIKMHPKSLEIYDDAIGIALKAKDPAKALLYRQKSVTNNPGNPIIRYRLILLQLEQGNPAEAITNCKTILGTSPKFLEAANLLSRILSTHPDEKVRSPQEAFALASRLCQISKNKNGNHLLTLAYAQANLAKYEDATTTLNLLTLVAPTDLPFTKAVMSALARTKANQPIRAPDWK
ncbi:MAG: tetratricopeptide repeat protein [Akkermansiaceae bacterium]